MVASFSDAKAKDDKEEESENKMVVSITGATGFVGTKLVESLLKDGHEVRVLTRSIKQAKKKLKPETLPKGTLLLIEPTKWPLGIKGSTHVVNLAGEPISTSSSWARRKTNPNRHMQGNKNKRQLRNVTGYCLKGVKSHPGFTTT